MVELILDKNIRKCVFLPILIISILVEIISDQILFLISTEEHTELRQIEEFHILRRSRILLNNGKFINKHAFEMRRELFNNKDKGYLMNRGQVDIAQYITKFANNIIRATKMRVMYVFPMLILGSWISSVFSGFLITRVPFLITLRFRKILQKTIKLKNLEAAWVSSLSWYSLNVFGLRKLHNLISTDYSDYGDSVFGDLSAVIANMPMNSKTVFKSHQDSLQLYKHEWALENVADGLLLSY